MRCDEIIIYIGMDGTVRVWDGGWFMLLSRFDDAMIKILCSLFAWTERRFLCLIVIFCFLSARRRRAMGEYGR